MYGKSDRNGQPEDHRREHSVKRTGDQGNVKGESEEIIFPESSRYTG